jgi:uncharacterized membrane protein YbhN (UPF0104 family)
LKPSIAHRLRSAWPTIKIIAQLAIVLLVLWGLAKAVRDSQAEFAKHEFSVWSLSPAWIAVSCLFYALATFPAAWFWWDTMLAMGQRPGRWESFRAYYVGHLGKYVPFKAMVVVIRAAMVQSKRVDAAVAALAVFVETLTLMAVGAVIAAIILALQHRDQPLLITIAIGLALCAGVPTAPPLFRRIVGILRVAKASPQVTEALHGLKLGLMLRGWLAMALSWVLMGFSLWAALKSMPGVEGDLNDLPKIMPLLIASIALATVAGFVSFVPGGFFVRELVVAALVAPALGEVAALVSAVVLRLVSIVSEVVVSIILYLCVRRKAP